MKPGKGRIQCIICDKHAVGGSLKCCTNAECPEPYYVHEECIRLQLVNRKLLKIKCESCEQEDRYQKIQSRPFYKYRWLMGIAFLLVVSFGPQSIARFSNPEKVEAMGHVQLVVFSWIVSFMVLLALALFVIVLTCMAKPLGFIRDTLMPAQIQYLAAKT